MGERRRLIDEPQVQDDDSFSGANSKVPAEKARPCPSSGRILSRWATADGQRFRYLSIQYG